LEENSKGNYIPIVNLSIGTEIDTDNVNKIAINKLKENGTIVVAASGNYDLYNKC